MNKLKSFLYTLMADLAADIVMGLLMGFATLTETGDYTAAAIVALATATARTALAASFRRGAEKIKKLRNAPTE